MTEDEPVLIDSSKSQDVVVDGYRFSIQIYRLEEEQNWTLEVVDPEGASHVWDELFKSDKDARNGALRELESQGALGFMHGDNVVPFRA
jgi:hypothetical protein